VKYIIIALFFSACANISIDTELTDHYEASYPAPKLTRDIGPVTRTFNKQLDQSISDGLYRLDHEAESNKYVDSTKLDAHIISDVMTSDTDFAGFQEVSVTLHSPNSDVVLISHMLTPQEQSQRRLYLDPTQDDLTSAMEILRNPIADLRITLTALPSLMTMRKLSNDMTIHVMIDATASL
jgi:hypothetical protein